MSIRRLRINESGYSCKNYTIEQLMNGVIISINVANFSDYIRNLFKKL